MDKILEKLPKFDQLDLTTFTPYDINSIGLGLITKDEDSTQDFRVYIAISLGLVSTATLAILLGFCVYVRKQQLLKNGDDF